jgi:histidinol-phosphate aminotransferase
VSDGKSSVSRRGFLKGSILGGAALTVAPQLALAEQMITGKAPSIKDIWGPGLEAGRIKLDNNENSLGPSPRAIQAVASNMFDLNRYSGGVSATSTDLDAAVGEELGIAMPSRGRRGGGDQSSEERMRAFIMRDPKIKAAFDKAAQANPEILNDEALQRAFFMEQYRAGNINMESNSGPFLFTTGSEMALELIALSHLSQKGGEVIEAERGYQFGISAFMVRGYSEKFGVPINIIRTPMTSDHKHDLDAMLSAVTPNTTLIVITNPNNPTSTIVPYDELERFVDAVPPHVTVLVDEAYIHFVDEPDYQSAVKLATSRENVVVTRTFSKLYGLVQMQLGYTVSGQKLKSRLSNYHTSKINKLASAAGVAAVKDHEHVRRTLRMVKAFKERCYGEFDAMGLEYIKSHSNFLTINTNMDSATVLQGLAKRNVRISNSGLRDLKTWVRVSAGTLDETEIFLKEFKAVLG